MTPEEAVKRHAELHGQMRDTLTVIRGLLARLPDPVALPPEPAGKEEANELARSLTIAWHLCRGEPLSGALARQLQDMITDWLTAYKVAALAAEHGVEPWHLAAMELAYTRIHEAGPAAWEQLDLELRDLELRKAQERRPGKRRR